MAIIRKEVIGDCTLYLGDCKEIIPTIGAIDSIVTDPPYGMCFVSNFRRPETKHIPIQNDENTDFLKFTCELKAAHSKYIFCRWENLVDVSTPKSCITWVKNNHSMGDLKHEHARQTEICLFYNGEKHFFPNDRPNDVIWCDRTGNNFHPTEKPVDLMGVLVSYTSGTVIDPFMGSGATGIACQKQKRKFIGIEIEEKYFDISCNRIRDAYSRPDMFSM